MTASRPVDMGDPTTGCGDGPAAAREQAGTVPPLASRPRIATRCVCCGSDAIQSSPAILMPFVAHRAFGWYPVEIDESWGLRTIRNGMAYSVCKSLHCTACGFLFLDIRFSDDELGNLYHDYRGPAYNALREQYEPGYTSRNDALNAGSSYIEQCEQFLAPFVEFPLSLLDWGGDTGRNTPFKGRCDIFDIYDISAKPVIDGATVVGKAEAFAKKYGLVVCSNVLEHVPYPADVLADITRTMDAGSVLYVEVPLEPLMREALPEPHLKRRHWHEHINFYSEQSLRKLLEQCGLSTLALRRLRVEDGGSESWVFQVACRPAA
ncbi:TPA: class I SAM-dependent methyltransferase [Burkholderia vietnamiensis]|nr:class I SAM-dependent methyltransferase [Burkholderia vietnamiensis]